MVADRGNSRLVVFDHAGAVQQVITDDLLRLPSCLAVDGDDLILTDLGGDLLALDRDARARSLVDATPSSQRVAPWPNQILDGRPARPDLHDGTLHSPHSVAVAGDGTIFLTEWLIGGRQVRLQPQRVRRPSRR
ncbi:MAG: hypothetical protein J2P57_00365 [Acidimicrobiaceae bacterium]|nr:hypothetical protein [Acidimicrobiaceae bacterium]